MSPRRSRRAERRRRKRTTVSAATENSTKSTAGAISAATPPGGRERGLRFAQFTRFMRFTLFGVFGLLLLTPFIVTPATVYPFVVGKALWSRSLIEVAFALWAVLALIHTDYRPPRSWLLVLLAAGYCGSLLSAGFGVSPGHSLWSDYERMQGLVDRAHWVALAVVLASVLDTPRAWRALLQANLAAGTAMACIVIARALDIWVPYFGDFPESTPVRFGGPFGNPGFLSIYLLINLVLAAGFAARAWATATPPGGSGGRRGGVLLWAMVAALHLAGVVLAGSVGGFAGLIAATGLAALGFVWLGRGRGRLAAVVLLVVLATACTVLGARFLDPGRTATVALDRPAVTWPGGSALRYVGGVHLQRPSVQSRLAAWQAGLDGFAERPLLGWGPGNYVTVFGLFGSGYAGTAEPHDQAHSVLIELAATTGVAGLAAWLSLWGGALAVLVLAARAAPPPERALMMFAAAALAGHLVQLQFLFDTAAGTLVSTLLLAFAARLEPETLPPAWRFQFPAFPALLARTVGGRARAVFRWPGIRAAAGAAAVVLAILGLVVNGAILSAATKRHTASGTLTTAGVAEAIEAFPPMAAVYRKYLFGLLARNWQALHEQYPDRASRLLRRADREAAAAVEREPWNWRIAQLLAQLYRAVADTRPDYEDRALSHLARARELAPAREVFPVPLAPSGGLASDPLPGGSLELRWKPSPGAGYHGIAQAAGSGVWRTIHYAYGPAQGRLTVPGGFRYGIKACRYPRDCSAWKEWP